MANGKNAGRLFPDPTGKHGHGKSVTAFDKCPRCGRPFATEITTAGVRHEVICQSGHTWKIEKAHRDPKGTLYELEMKEEAA